MKIKARKVVKKWIPILDDKSTHDYGYISLDWQEGKDPKCSGITSTSHTSRRRRLSAILQKKVENKERLSLYECNTYWIYIVCYWGEWRRGKHVETLALTLKSKKKDILSSNEIVDESFSTGQNVCGVFNLWKNVCCCCSLCRLSNMWTRRLCRHYAGHLHKCHLSRFRERKRSEWLTWIGRVALSLRCCLDVLS